jgi:hypothetical protein
MADDVVRIDPAKYPRAEGILDRAERPKTEFSKVLSKLANDPAYREKATADPAVITREYKLTLKELQSLRQIAVMSGADITAVNKFRVSEFAARADLAATDVDVSCCSCCCCCCGETAVEMLASA